MIDNGECTLEALFRGNRFIVPPYQRAYAWVENPQLEAFINDLEQHRPLAEQGRAYFLGTILLTADATSSGTSENTYAVVDGQQRMTTSVLFIASALGIVADNATAVDEVQKANSTFLGRRTDRRFHTIETDDKFFDEHVLDKGDRGQRPIETPSMGRLMAARQFFDQKLSSLPQEEVRQLLRVLVTSKVLTYAVETASEATQIFEFQNDRGKRLTDLEALKSFLMHRLYLSGGDPGKTERHIKDVQSTFAELYRCAEQIEQMQGAPDEDAILGFHCAAFEPYEKVRDDREGWRHPKELIRQLLDKNMPTNRSADPEWIISFCSRLRDTFDLVRAILKARDVHRALGGLFVLRRVASFWPLLLKCWERDKSLDKREFVRVAEALERFAFRAAVAGTRADTGVEYLRRDLANKFDGNFDDIVAKLKDMSKTWWNLKERFKAGLDYPDFYSANPQNRYLLWRYENKLRSRRGQQQQKISWSEMIDKRHSALQITLDHIIPQNPKHPDEQAILERRVRWNETDDIERFEKVFLHRLGNLVLSTRSKNASKGHRPFSDFDKVDGAGNLHSQMELRTYATSKDDELVWDEDAIRRRHKKLRKFAIKL